MNRQQLSLVVVLGLISSIPAFAAGPSKQGGGWRTSSEETASSTLSGKLYRNSADQSGTAPYVVLDRWGVVRGYVAAAEGVDLDSCVGQQVNLQGTIKTLPGGDMPYMTCQRVLSGNAEMAHAHVQHARPRSGVIRSPRLSGTSGRKSLAARPPTRSDMAADPAPRTVSLPLHEVVLDPPTLPSPTIPRTVPARRRPRVNPRRSRNSAVQATDYQETLPTPAPSGDAHRRRRQASRRWPPRPWKKAHDFRGPRGLGRPDHLRRPRRLPGVHGLRYVRRRFLAASAATMIVLNPCWVRGGHRFAGGRPVSG